MTPEERDFICYDCPHHGRPMTTDPCRKCANGIDKHPVDYWHNISEMAAKQRMKGISAYGQPLEYNQVPDVVKRIEYYQEEMIDGLMYLEWVKDALKKLKS